jgi:hypothetical protein
MGIRILHDARADMAALYCSTSDFAFGPVFYERNGHSADERAEAFLRWLEANPVSNDMTRIFGSHDPRLLTSNELETAHSKWLAQEETQFSTEAA